MTLAVQLLIGQEKVNKVKCWHRFLYHHANFGGNQTMHDDVRKQRDVSLCLLLADSTQPNLTLIALGVWVYGP